jgi:hypothetical protein
MGDTGLSLHHFRDQARQELREIADKFPPPRTFTSPSFLLNYVALLTNSSAVPIETIPNGKGTLIVVTPADRDTVLSICSSFHRLRNFIKVLLVIPRSTAYIEQILSSESFLFRSSFDPHIDLGLQIVLREFHADFMPVDRDFFLMPSVNSLYQFAVDGDFNDLYSCARALAKIQTVFGAIPRVATVGENAKRVYDLMEGIVGQTLSGSDYAPQIDTLILVDRLADLVTPLKTTWTVEGLMDCAYQIQYGSGVIPVRAARGGGKGVRELRKLDEENTCFGSLRALTYEDAISFLKGKEDERAKMVDEFADAKLLRMEAFADLAHRAVEQARLKAGYSEMEACIGELIDLPTNKVYTKVQEHEAVSRADQKSITSLLKIADIQVTMMDDWESAMRLICLSGAMGKLDDAVIAKVQQELTAEFGAQAVDAVLSLDKLKILSAAAPSKGTWAALMKELKCVDDSDAFVRQCDEYVPLTVRVVEQLTRRSLGQKNITKSMTNLLGKRGVPLNCFPETPPSTEETGKAPKGVLVFFVGGVALHEVALIRAMAKTALDGAVTFLIGATDQVNQKTFLRQICPKLFIETSS